jgi:hypothetical protein
MFEAKTAHLQDSQPHHYLIKITSKGCVSGACDQVVLSPKAVAKSLGMVVVV